MFLWAEVSTREGFKDMSSALLQVFSVTYSHPPSLSRPTAGTKVHNAT